MIIFLLHSLRMLWSENSTEFAEIMLVQQNSMSFECFIFLCYSFLLVIYPYPSFLFDIHLQKSYVFINCYVFPQQMQITTGRYHTLLISNSSVFSCGSSLCGVLGHGPEITQCVSFTRINFPSAAHVVQVSASENHAAFVLQSGQVCNFFFSWCCFWLLNVCYITCSGKFIFT